MLMQVTYCLKRTLLWYNRVFCQLLRSIDLYYPIFLIRSIFRSMLSFRRIQRLKHNEQLPVVVLAITIVFVIHLCNKYDEKTANQYIPVDNNLDDHQSCPLYPSSLKGKSTISNG